LRQHGTAGKESLGLQKVQPAPLGLMDGSVSTLAPSFAAAGLMVADASSTRRRRQS